MILSARRCSTRVALTDAPARSGVPVETLAPSPISRTSPSSIVAPGSTSSFSTAITSSLATVYCLPPVRITANIMDRYRLARPPRQAAPGLKSGPGRPPRPGAAHYSCAPLCVNASGTVSGQRFRPLEPLRDVARTARLDSGSHPPPVVGGRGADRGFVRPGRSWRINRDRGRAGAAGSARGRRPGDEPPAGIGGARGDRTAWARYGEQRQRAAAEPGGPGAVAGPVATRPRLARACRTNRAAARGRRGGDRGDPRPADPDRPQSADRARQCRLGGADRLGLGAARSRRGVAQPGGA